MRLHYAVDAAADVAYDFRRRALARYRAVKFTTRAILNQNVSARAKIRGAHLHDTTAR